MANAEKAMAKAIDRFDRDIAIYKEEIQNIKNRIASYEDLIRYSQEAKITLIKALDAIRSEQT